MSSAKRRELEPATVAAKRVKKEPSVKQECTVKHEPAEHETPPAKRQKRAAHTVKQEVKCEALVKREVKREAPVKQECGPFPTHLRPTEQECRLVHRALASLHPGVIERLQEVASGCGGQRSVLDALVSTILSQNTTDTNSRRAFGALKLAFPSWEAVRAAPEGALAEAIRCGGLADIKAGRICAILDALHAERGECSLDHLRAEPDEAVKAALRRFKGVGAKTISCVLLFCLRRQDFPVDTHVWKIALALGWVPKHATRDTTYEHLNGIVPGELKHELHVLLVEHGKARPSEPPRLRRASARQRDTHATSRPFLFQAYKNEVKVLRGECARLA